MLDSFLNYFIRQKIEIRKYKVLCAVSGGKDSMVMLDLFLKAEINVGVAHINHKTRGEENELDYEMIKSFCNSKNIPLYYKELEDHIPSGPNFHAFARNLRYKWMEEILIDEGYNYIATAHHMDDNVESLIMNLLRGSGLKGLSGISSCKDGIIIRPLFYFSRNQIDQYQDENDVRFREDSSNEKEFYLRNKIRHQILSNLKRIDKNAVFQMNESIKLIAESETLLDYLITKDDDLCFEHAEDKMVLDLKKIKEYPSPGTILWYKLSPFGFNKFDIQDILNSDRSGAEFHSKSHKLILSRKKLYLQIKELKASKSNNIEIVEEGSCTVDKVRIDFQLVENLELTKHENVEYMGFKSNPFPLIIRPKKQGDYFHPLGLKGKSKKVKDFITDQKLDFADKEKLLILEKDGKIVCLLGFRISELFKVDKDSKFILKVTKRVMM
jgi:tRNA(Ile)-lysidine synthase